MDMMQFKKKKNNNRLKDEDKTCKTMYIEIFNNQNLAENVCID